MSSLLCLALAACSASDLTGAWGVITPANLNGSWWRVGEVPGSSEHWQLTMTGSTVIGTGTWSGEACCDGTLTVNGFASGDSLHVDVAGTVTAGAQFPPWKYHFDGVMVTDTLLVGPISAGGSPSEFRKGTQFLP